MTPSLISKLFPDYTREDWKEVNLNEMASIDFPGQYPSPLNNPDTCNGWLYQGKNIWFSYGGYGEDRSHLWRGQYMLPEKPIHLGVDFNIFPESQPICSPINGHVLDSWIDPDQNGGWGGRIIVETGTLYVVFGHLSENQIARWSRLIKVGDCIGKIAPSNKNGGWYRHLHLQCIDKTRFRESGFYQEDLLKIDGYGTEADLFWNVNPLEALPD